MFRNRLTIILIVVLSLAAIALWFLKRRLTVSTGPQPATPNPISLVSINPANGAQSIMPGTPIRITFSAAYPEPTKCLLQISPFMGISVSWPDPQTLIAYPQTAYAPNTIYAISLNCPPISATTTFTSNPNSSAELKSQSKIQSADDYRFGQIESQFYAANPWYHKLPIVKPEYNIVYDFERQSFRIINKSSLSTNALLPRVLQDLEQLNAGTASAKYYFVSR